MYPETYNAHIGLFDSLLIIRGTSKIAIDLYMYILFFGLLSTFIKRVEIQHQGLTLYHRIIIMIIMTSAIANIVYSLIVAICVSLLYSHLVTSSLFLEIMIQPVMWLCNTITLAGLLFLFLKQSELRREKNEVRNRVTFSSLITTSEEAEQDSIEWISQSL